MEEFSMNNDNNIILKENEFPDIDSYLENGNPVLRSPNSSYELPFMQTKESLMDIDNYSRFIHNAISLFRHTRVYKNYKAYLMEMGLDHCQYLHNINSEMATIEMNHCIITLFDIAFIICEHLINTYGYCSTFHIVSILREEHTSNRIPLIMMSKTVHQLYHNDDLFFVHPKQIFGKWVDFLSKYRNGITPDICAKLLYYIRTAMSEDESTDNDLLSIANEIKKWSDLNYGSTIEPVHSIYPNYDWVYNPYGYIQQGI